MLDPARIRAITLDLDDTLWPIEPTIRRAEATLQAWLALHAPATGALCAAPGAVREVRHRMNAERPDLAHDMSALRRESIRVMLVRAGDDPALAEPAFDAFFAARQQVTFYDDALAALEFLSSRYPVVALSNGNADVRRVGIGHHFCAAFNATTLGVGKPDPRMFQVARGRPAPRWTRCCTSVTTRTSTAWARSMPACRWPGSTAGGWPGSIRCTSRT